VSSVPHLQYVNIVFARVKDRDTNDNLQTLKRHRRRWDNVDASYARYNI